MCYKHLKNPKKLDLKKGFKNDQIIYEIITNQFTPIPVAAPLTHFCAPNLSFQVITEAPLLQISFHYNFLSLNFKNMFAKKELYVYMERKRILQKNQIMSWFRLQTRT